MAILGVYEGHNAGAALLSERSGEVLAAVEEERFSRIKNHDARPGADGLPARSLEWVVQRSLTLGEPISAVALGLMDPDELQTRAWANFIAAVNHGEPQRLLRAAELGMDYETFADIPRASQSARVTRALLAVGRAGVDVDALRVVHVEHHQCHAAAAFLLAPVDRALVVTLDGKGDDLSGGIWVGVGERLEPIALIPTEDSLGHLYSAATVACGFRPQRDEGKLMALAARGQLHPGLDKELRRWVSFDGTTGRPRSSLSRGIVQGPYPDRVPGFHNDRLIGMTHGIDHADVAATVQGLVEEIVICVVQHHLEAAGEDILVVAGGLFANVSLNRRLGQLACVRELHVHPGMTDSGIAVGAAAWAYARRKGQRPAPLQRLDLGPSFGVATAMEPFADAGYRPVNDGRPHEVLAEALASGLVVGRFVGGCEYGPRALGYRSIFAPAHSERTLEALNLRLGRSQIMPFAPIVLAEWVPLLFTDRETVRGPMRFMTTAVGCTERARSEMPAAVHADGTARPQVVDADLDPGLAILLREYQRLSGRMGLVNTSFNLHDEPIVCTPTDAARSADSAQIPFVQVGESVMVKDTYRHAS